MSISEKIKAINNKIVQSKAWYNLNRQTAKISALSSGNVSKYEFLTGTSVFPKKDFLEKAATLKRFEYSQLGKAFKNRLMLLKSRLIVINKKEDKRNRLLKPIIRTNKNYRDKMENALLHLPKKI